jgi:hypothetical protein
MNKDFPVIVASNFFNEKELLDLKKSIDEARTIYKDKFNLRINERHSRIDNAFDIPSSILNKITDFAHQFGSKNLLLTHYNSYRYESKYGGNTEVTPHLDKDETQFSINYQLDSNIEWDLAVIENNDTKYATLKNNEALIFSASKQVHWRKKKVLKENEYCDMIIFHFAEPTFLKNSELDIQDQKNNLKKAFELFNNEN